jgi:hypothetical protein
VLNFSLYILRCNIRPEAIVMNLRIPIVCLVFSVVIIGVCILAREAATQTITVNQHVGMPTAQMMTDR